MSRRSIAAACSTLVLAANLAAQTGDPVADRIFRLGMDSSRVQSLAQTFLDSVGPRLTGSPGMKSASDWVIKTYTSWGIDARSEQYGTWRGWRRGTSHIDLMQPRVRSLEGTMLAWSPGTRPAGDRRGDRLAEVRRQHRIREMAAPGSRQDRAVARVAHLPASEDWIRWSTPAARAAMDTAVGLMQREWAVDRDSAKLYRGTGYSLSLGTGTLGMRLEKAGVAGMITSRPKLSGFRNPFPQAAGQGGGVSAVEPAGGARSARRRSGRKQGNPPAAAGSGFGGGGAAGSGGWGVIEIFETYNTTAPAVTLTCEDYGLLYRLAANSQRPVVKLDLDAQLLGRYRRSTPSASSRESRSPMNT